MAGNHTGSSLSPMSYRPACPLPFLKACTWVRHFFLSKFTSSICIQWMCVGFYYGCDRVYVYDGINKLIYSPFSVFFQCLFKRFTNALLRQWNMYLVLKPSTHEPLAFCLPFHVFFFVSDSMWYFVTIYLSAYWIFLRIFE